MKTTQKPVSPFRLCSLLRLQRDPKLALQLFQNPNPNPTSPPKKPFPYSLRSYDLIISKLGRAKMFDQMEQILHQLKQETRFSPHEIIFCNVISFYGRARLPERAFQTFEQIHSFRCERTVKSVNSLLDALLKSRDFGKMREIFVEIEKYGGPDACSYNILIHACVLSGNMDDAWNVFDQMPKRGISPNAVTFGTLIYGLSLNFKLKEAIKLKEDIVNVYRVQPSAYVYASLIKGLCGIGELSLAFKLKEEMKTNNIKLDSAVYSTLVSALFKFGRKEEVFGLLDQMRENGTKPDTVIFNAMINGFCKEKNFESAYKILDEMMEKGCKPDVISFNIIIGGLCKEGKWNEANDLFEDMPRRGCLPDVVSYRTLFDGFCEAMRFKEAIFILDEMIFKSFMPRSTSVSKLVDGLCKEGDMELLWTAFNSLGRQNAIDADTWSMVISIACKDNLLEACDFVDTMTNA